MRETRADTTQAFVYAIALHVLLFALMFLGLWWTRTTAPQSAAGSPIEAELIDPDALSARMKRALAQRPDPIAPQPEPEPEPVAEDSVPPPQPIPEPLPDDPEMLAGRPEARNLVGIMAAVTGETPAAILQRFAGQGFGAFKPALADATIALLAPLRERLIELRNDPAMLDGILAAGAEKAVKLAAPTLHEAYRAVGLRA